MLELRNRTPFQAAMVPGIDRTRLETLTVVVKGTFTLGSREELPVSDQQQPLLPADVPHGEPGASSLKYEADHGPAKRGTDVVLIGHAWSREPVTSLDVRLAAGPLEKTVRVFGDRIWYRALGAWKISDPATFSRMPLVYERAFGGADQADPDPARHGFERRNPVGVGFAMSDAEERVEGQRLPNLEDPRALIQGPLDRPPPAGFGWVARDWMPRAGYAGTYDARWREERFPFLPEDFDERYFNSASAGLTAARPLRGGEPVRVAGAAEGGELHFRVPRRALSVTIAARGAAATHAPHLDTLLIEPDERRVTLTWRVTVPCPRRLLYIDHVTVREGGAA
jgi:hypothetical protein